MQTMYTYKNISEQELAVPDVGVVKPGEEIKVSEEINNANFELLTKTEAGDTSKSAKIINDETETE